jgi:hypothetical protein
VKPDRYCSMNVPQPRIVALWIAVVLGGSCACSAVPATRTETKPHPQPVAARPYRFRSTNQTIYAVAFDRHGFGWAVGRRGLIMHQEGGKWAPVATSLDVLDLYALAFDNDDRLWTVGVGGAIVRREKQGTWTVVRAPNQSEAPLLGITMDNEGRGWAVGGRQIIRLENTMARALVNPSGVVLRSVAMDSNGRTWAAGDEGVVMTSDGSDAWTVVTKHELPRLYGIAVDKDGTVWAVASSAQVFMRETSRSLAPDTGGGRMVERGSARTLRDCVRLARFRLGRRRWRHCCTRPQGHSVDTDSNRHTRHVTRRCNRSERTRMDRR